MTAPTVAPAQSPTDARREAELRALEAAITAAVVVGVAKAVKDAVAVLRAGFRYAATDPARWLLARRRAARILTTVRPRLAAPLERMLPQAARLGATHAGAPLPPGHDPSADDLVARILDSIDRDTRTRLTAAATRIVADPVDTPTRLDAAVTRVEAVQSTTEAQAGEAVARAASDGVVAAADASDIPLVWVAERTACLSCTSMAGSMRGRDGLFHPVTVYAPRLIPWLKAGVTGVPAHRACRCHLAPATAGLADGLAREAARSVARGWSDYDSLVARLAALDKVITSSRLPKTVKARAAADKAAGRFTRGPFPGRSTSTRRAA